MIGDGFDVLHLLRIGFIEIGGQRIQVGDNASRKGRHLLNLGGCGQRFKPFDFDRNPVLNQPEFRKQRTQGGHFTGVAAIEGGEGGERSEFHEASL